MTLKKKNFLFMLGGISLIADSHANSPWSFLNQEESTIKPPLVCGYNDSAWYDKSGPNSVKIPKVESQTLYLDADSISGQNKQVHIAQGNVVGYKDDQTFSSDWLIYDQPAGRVTAGDNMVLTRQYDSVRGQWADYYLDTQKGTFTQATVYYNKDDMTATGQQLNLQDKNHLSIDNATFTTCNPNDPDWYIRSEQTNFDYQNSQGTARNATMYFESLPLFSTPYMSFPLGERRSGWLTPKFSGTSNAGFMAAAPYYWNMAPNYDMTITPELWANQGLMITDEFRYKTESGAGSMYTEQMPGAVNWNDGAHRDYWSLNDTHNPLQDVQVGYKYNSVSDNNYFNDFGNFYSITDNVNLEQSVFASYKPTWGLASAKLQNYQTLYPYGSNSTVPIYASYPALNFNVNPQDIGGGFKGGIQTQYTNFFSPALQSGQRTIAYPSLTYPLQSSWGFATPKFGYNYTNYVLGATPSLPNSAMTTDRGLPVTSLDSGLYFDRPLGLSTSGLTQTFEPRAYYLYIPEQNQSQIPLFDTATATYNYNQLFSENRFSGYDRINSANDITLGGTTRILNDSNGTELMNFSAGYRYFIQPQNNFLYGNTTQYSQLFLPAPNAIAELTNNWSKQITTNANFQYSSVYNTVDAYGVGVKYNPDDGKVLNVRYTYQYQLPLLYYTWVPGQNFTPASYENQYALNVSGQWPIYQNKLFAIGKTNYDFTLQQFLNVIGGLEYNAGCYTVSAVYENFIFNVNQSNTTYFLQFSFKGIGGVGSGDPSNDMKINVPGYMPINQLN